MNSAKPIASLLVKLKYLFYSCLLKIKSDNKKFIRKKILYGSILITTSTILLSYSSRSQERKCYKVSLDSLTEDSILKLKANEKSKADSIKKINFRKEDSIKKHK